MMTPEQVVLGAAIFDPSNYDKVGSMLLAVDFAEPEHQVIWASIQAMNRSHQIVDVLTLTDYLRKNKLLDRVGGAEYLSRLIDYPGSVYIEESAKIIVDVAMESRLNNVALAIRNICQNHETSAKEKFSLAIRELNRVSARVHLADCDSFHNLAVKVFEEIGASAESVRQILGIPSGLEQLDRVMLGWQEGMNVIAARPSMGKSALAVQLAIHAAKKRHKVVIFSYESTAKSLFYRALAREAKISSTRIRLGNTSSYEMEVAFKKTAELASLPIDIYSDATTTVEDIRLICRKRMAKNDLSLVIIDYLQLVQPENRRENRLQQVDKIAYDLAALSLETHIPIITLAQLKRKQDDRSWPTLADLRESGAIEAAAATVLFIHPDWKEIKEQFIEDLKMVPMFLSVAKNRDGTPGVVPVIFNREQVSFYERTEV